MRFAILPAIVLATLCSGQTTTARSGTIDRALEPEIRRVMNEELDLVLRGDAKAMARFYPDDMVVTNPFHQLIDKQKVLERVRTNIIRYSSYEKTIEYLHALGETVVVMGLEVVKATADADRPDAGKTTRRRFSEAWMRRGGRWQKILRHASNID